MTIRPEFNPQRLSPAALDRICELRAAFSALLDEVERCVPAGRERDLVLDKLQEACMWAVRGVSQDGPAAQLADQMRRGVARFVGPEGT